MAINKVFSSPAAALEGITDGCTIMLGGFGTTGVPFTLIRALRNRGTAGITAVTNSSGGRLEDRDISVLFSNRQIKKVITSFTTYSGKVSIFEQQYLRGEVELELVPQGTLAERIRAGGAGIAGFYIAVGMGTIIEQGKEKRAIDGKEYLFERGLTADFALVKAHQADRLGNLVYRMSARNFNPLMAMAGRVTIAEVDEIVAPGELDPEKIATPGIFVDRVVLGKKYEVAFK